MLTLHGVCIGTPPRVFVGSFFGLAIAFLGSSSAAETIVIGFEDLPAEEPPVGFTIATTGDGPEGRWIVQEDEDSPSGTKVLVQVSEEPRRPQFPLAIYDQVSAADVDLSVEFKPISGEVDQAAGLVWRYLDENNYYIVRANALEGNVVLYKVEDGERTDLPLLGEGRTYGVDVPVPTGSWSTLAVSAKGDRFAVRLDGTELFQVEDDTFTEAGNVGLWTKADSVTAFDNLSIVFADP